MTSSVFVDTKVVNVLTGCGSSRLVNLRHVSTLLERLEWLVTDKIFCA